MIAKRVIFWEDKEVAYERTDRELIRKAGIVKRDMKTWI